MRVFGIALSLIFAASPMFADTVAYSLTPYSPTLTTFSTITFQPDAMVVSGTTSHYAAPWDYTIGGPWKGNYLTTGVGSFTIGFATPQTELTFLWGSVDAYNTISFNNGNSYTGVQFAALTGFANPPLGSQIAGGSAYADFQFTDQGDTPFTTVTFSSSQYAFEVAGFAVPDGGMTLMLLGGALFGLGTLRRKFRA